MNNQINQSSEDGDSHAAFSFIPLERMRKAAQPLLSICERQVSTEPNSIIMTPEAINFE